MQVVKNNIMVKVFKFRSSLTDKVVDERLYDGVNVVCSTGSTGITCSTFYSCSACRMLAVDTPRTRH